MVRTRLIASILRGSLLLLAGSLTLGACSKKEEDTASARPAAIPDKEAARGKQACEVYVERVCACAKTQTEFQDACAMAPARLQALQLNLELAAKGEGLTKEDIQAVKVEARKVMSGCFEDMQRLDDKGCPR